jgi:hypothetical protein
MGRTVYRLVKCAARQSVQREKSKISVIMNLHILIMLNHVSVALFPKFCDHFSKRFAGLLGLSPKHFPKSVQQWIGFLRESYGESTSAATVPILHSETRVLGSTVFFQTMRCGHRIVDVLRKTAIHFSARVACFGKKPCVLANMGKSLDEF